MSSELAHFLYQDRTLKGQLTLNVSELRCTVEDIIALLYPQRGRIQLQNANDAQHAIDNISQKLTSAVKALSPLKPGLQAEKLIETFLAGIPEIAAL